MNGTSQRTPWPGDWVVDAACRGKDAHIFFPSDDKSVEEARAICRTCPVQDACLQYALDTSTRYGVWGGTSQRQRQRMNRRAAQIGIADTRPRINGRFAARGAS